MSDLGCALDKDGELMDASNITFYNDPDDDTPISGPPGSTTTSTRNMHPFFSGAHSPAVVVAGSRRSARVPRPSTRVMDPDNAEANTSTAVTAKRLQKRKVDDAPSGRHVARRMIAESDSDLEEGNTNDNGDAVREDYTSDDAGDGDPTDVDEDDVEVAYASTKAMGDADREVSFWFHFNPLIS